MLTQEVSLMLCDDQKVMTWWDGGCWVGGSRGGYMYTNGQFTLFLHQKPANCTVIILEFKSRHLLKKIFFKIQKHRLQFIGFLCPLIVTKCSTLLAVKLNNGHSHSATSHKTWLDPLHRLLVTDIVQVHDLTHISQSYILLTSI